MRRDSLESETPTSPSSGQASVALIIVVGAAILIGAAYALRFRSVVAPAFLVLAALYACITPNGVEYPKDLIREVALWCSRLSRLSLAASRIPPRQRSRVDILELVGLLGDDQEAEGKQSRPEPR